MEEFISSLIRHIPDEQSKTIHTKECTLEDLKTFHYVW
jgi:hypothetical protein